MAWLTLLELFQSTKPVYPLVVYAKARGRNNTGPESKKLKLELIAGSLDVRINDGEIQPLGVLDKVYEWKKGRGNV